MLRIADVESFHTVNTLGAEEQVSGDGASGRHFDRVEETADFGFCRIFDVDDGDSVTALGDVEIVAFVCHLASAAGVLQGVNQFGFAGIADVVDREIFSAGGVEVTFGDLKGT